MAFGARQIGDSTGDERNNHFGQRYYCCHDSAFHPADEDRRQLYNVVLWNYSSGYRL